ncbi:MAG: hypothetical protein ACJ761_08680 [Chloroflexota bacterium]
MTMVPGPRTLTRSYKGKLAEATIAFQHDAEELAKQGYLPTSQTFGLGGWGPAAFRLAILVHLAFGRGLPAGTLVVTYAYQGGRPAADPGDVLDLAVAPAFLPQLVSNDGVRAIPAAIGYLLVVILALPILVIGMVAYLLGPEALAGIATHAAQRAMEAPIDHVSFGVAMIVLAAFGSLDVYRRRRQPEATVLAVVLWGVFAFIMVAIGVIAVATAVDNPIPEVGF